MLRKYRHIKFFSEILLLLNQTSHEFVTDIFVADSVQHCTECTLATTSPTVLDLMHCLTFCRFLCVSAVLPVKAIKTLRGNEVYVCAVLASVAEGDE